MAGATTSLRGLTQGVLTAAQGDDNGGDGDDDGDDDSDDDGDEQGCISCGILLSGT